MQSGARSVDDVRAEVVGRLCARRDELVDAIFARVRGHAFDRAGEEDAEYLAGLRSAGLSEPAFDKFPYPTVKVYDPYGHLEEAGKPGPFYK